MRPERNLYDDYDHAASQRGHAASDQSDDPTRAATSYDPHNAWLARSLAETRRRHRRGLWLLVLLGVPVVVALLVVAGWVWEAI